MKGVVNYAVSALENEQLAFVKLKLEGWGVPVAPCAAPSAERWGARAAPSPPQQTRGDIVVPLAGVREEPAETPLAEEVPSDPRCTIEELIGPGLPAHVLREALPPDAPHRDAGHYDVNGYWYGPGTTEAFDFEPFRSQCGRRCRPVPAT